MDTRVSLPPELEGWAASAPTSVRLKASSNAAVELFMCALHSARRLELSLTTSDVMGFPICLGVSH